MLKVSLRVVGGKHDGELVPLTSSKFLIGRENDCHLRPNSEMVSRHHCAFALDDFAVRLRDLGSTNGTLVNGERIRGVVQLKPGDRVAVGKLEFQIQIGDDAAAGTKLDPSILQGETAELAGDDTHYEMPSFQFEPEPAKPETDQTAVVPRDELRTAPPAPPPAPPQPVAAAQPAAPMPGYGYPGGYSPGFPYGMGFPGPMPGYYPQYPAYPQYPYPQPVVMGQPYPGYPPSVPEQPAPAQPAAEPDVRLPDPKTTGLAATSAPTAAATAAADKNPSQHAADIIRQHLQRRPEFEEKK